MFASMLTQRAAHAVPSPTGGSDGLSGFAPRSPKSRRPDRGEVVKVYRNLNNGLLSIMSTQGADAGKVLGYARAVVLGDVVFTVGERSRQRAIREHCRNVHAFARGRLWQALSSFPDVAEAARAISYNPFRAGHFHLKGDVGSPVWNAQVCWLFEGQAFVT